MLFTIRLLVGAALSAGLILTSPSYAAGPFQYLIDAANQIKQIEYSKTVLTEDDNGRIVRIACDSLKQLAEDPSFKTALSDILSRNNLQSTQSPAYDLVANLATFNSVFLPAEQDNLRRAGLEYPAVFDALQIASRERLRANLKEISAVAVMDKIHTARDAVCRMAATSVAERQRKAAQWTFGGVTLIVVDVAGAIGIASLSSGVLAVAAGAVAVSSIDIGANAAINGAKGDIP
jgi:hypothetical protein